MMSLPLKHERREEDASGLRVLRWRVGLSLGIMWVLFAVTALMQLPFMSSVSAATGEPVSITGFELQNAGEDASMVRLLVRTSTGEALAPEQVGFKVKNRVVRLTFVDVPLSDTLGVEVPFEVHAINRVEKGYAIPDGESQSMVRLRFDVMASEAIEGHVVEPAPGGFAVVLPFGRSLEPAQAAAQPADKQPSVDEAGTRDEAKAAFDALVKEIGDHQEAPGEDAQGEVAGTPLKVDTKKAGTPLKLAQSGEGPSVGRVGLSLAVILLLIMAMAVGYNRLRGSGGGAPWRLAVKRGVKVLSTHRIARGVQIMIVDIVGDVVVLGQSQAGLSMLYKVPADKAALYRGESGAVSQPVASHSADGAHEGSPVLGEALKSLLGQLQGQGAQAQDLAPFEPEAPMDSPETLEELAASLEPLPAESSVESIVEPEPAAEPEKPRRRTVARLITTPKGGATAGGDAEPADFESFLERRMAQRAAAVSDSAPGAQIRRGPQSGAARPPRGPNTLPTRGRAKGKDDENLDDVTRSIRNRARALGRL